jgi:hypothetical protein
MCSRSVEVSKEAELLVNNIGRKGRTKVRVNSESVQAPRPGFAAGQKRPLRRPFLFFNNVDVYIEIYKVYNHYWRILCNS